MSEKSLKKLYFYKNGKIYRIVCNVTGIQYIGSTCKTLTERLQQHRSSYKSYRNHTYKGKYTTIFQVLYNNNYDIILIEDFPCDRKEQLKARERFYIESMTCVNKYYEYQKEYREDNRDKLKEYQKEYQKEYNENNREIINEKIP